MTKKNEPVRTYKFSDGQLYGLAKLMLLNITRDLAELAGYGVNATTVNDFKALISAFLTTPADRNQRGIGMGLTAKRAELRGQVELLLRSLKTQVAAHPGITPTEVQLLGIGSISRAKDSNLHRTGRQAVKFATTLLPLPGSGVDAAYLASLAAVLDAYNAAINAHIQEKRDRKRLKALRVKRGNDLYAEVVRLSSKGKDCFYATSRTRYDAYVIYSD